MKFEYFISLLINPLHVTCLTGQENYILDKTESCQLIADGAGNRYGVTSVKIQDTQRWSDVSQGLTEKSALGMGVNS